MELSKKQKDLLMDAHLMDKPLKDADLLKAKLVDKQGKVTTRGIKECHNIAAAKHKGVWG